jgi:hypothetical protein
MIGFDMLKNIQGQKTEVLSFDPSPAIARSMYEWKVLKGTETNLRIPIVD